MAGVALAIAAGGALRSFETTVLLTVEETLDALRAAEASQNMSIETSRLSLLPSSPQQVLALIEEPVRFAELTGFAAADGLRKFFVSDDVSPEWLAALRSASSPDPWRHGFFVVERGERRVIGSAGFKGPPDSSGVVEIAYGIVPICEGNGYATEAAKALVAFASSTPEVRIIRAHTLPEPNASTRVLLKCGFRHTASVVDPEDGPVWRWERGADTSRANTSSSAGHRSR